jgi:Amt family ammonium transporter
MTSVTKEELTAMLEEVKTGASSSWILSASALIFFMQLGFIMVEAAAVRRQHWSAVLMKNLLDCISGAIGFWIIGFSIAFSKPDSSGFIGMGGNKWAASAGWSEVFTEELFLKFIF